MPKLERPQIQRPTINRPAKAVIQKPVRVPRGMVAPDFETIYEPDNADPLADVDYENDDFEQVAQQEVDITLAALLAQRRHQKEMYRVTNGDEFWFAVCFQSQKQKDDFLQQAGWQSLGDKYLDGLKLATHLGLAIEPIPLERPKTAKISKKGGENL
jgi:hypothetical protein